MLSCLFLYLPYSLARVNILRQRLLFLRVFLFVFELWSFVICLAALLWRTLPGSILWLIDVILFIILTFSLRIHEHASLLAFPLLIILWVFFPCVSFLFYFLKNSLHAVLMLILFDYSSLKNINFFSNTTDSKFVSERQKHQSPSPAGQAFLGRIAPYCNCSPVY